MGIQRQDKGDNSNQDFAVCYDYLLCAIKKLNRFYEKRSLLHLF